MSVINLNKARKAKARADENAVKFGQSKSQKTITAARKAQLSKHLDGHKTDG